jgi:hypothetical protein
MSEIITIICVVIAIFIGYELYKRSRLNDNNKWGNGHRRLTERYNSDSEQISHGLNVYDAYPQIYNNSYYGQYRDLDDASVEIIYTEDPSRQRRGLYF